MSNTAGQPAAIYQVFLSHAVEDKDVALAICEALERHGLRCWIAPRDILPGKDWAEAITDATDSCRVMVLVYSAHSNASAHVRREVERAVSSGAFLIPFRIADVPMSKALAYFLHSCQWLDALGPPLDKHVSLLVSTVRTLLQKEAPAAAFARLALAGAEKPSTAKGGGQARAALVAGGAIGSLMLAVLLVLGIWSLAASGNRGTPTIGPTSTAPAQAKPVSIAGTVVTPSEVVLRGGNFLVRSEGLSVRNATSAATGRAVLLSNRRDATNKDLEGGAQATISVQLNNQSHERVTISQVELLLLGIVTVVEDQINEPQSPLAVQQPEDLLVEESDPRRKEDYADLTQVFKDSNDPPSELRYSVQVDPPGAIGATIDANQKLDLTFASDRGGSTEVKLTATNAFQYSAVQKFRVTVKGKVDPSVPLAVVVAMANLSNVGQPAKQGVVPEFVVEEKRQDLGTVLLSYMLGKGDLVQSASSGNLLPEEESSALRANSARSLAIRVGCLTKFELPQPPKDLLEGEGGRRLAAYPPRLAAVVHLLAVRVRLNSEDGTRCDLYSDNLYLLQSSPFEIATLMHAAELSPDKAIGELLGLAIRTNEQTIAFERGKVCGLQSLPAGDVSEFCFFQNAQHPLRRKSGVTFAASDRWSRSNLVPVLAAVQKDHAPLSPLLALPLDKLASQVEPVAKAKAAYVQGALQHPPALPQSQPTYVQVVAPQKP